MVAVTYAWRCCKTVHFAFNVSAIGRLLTAPFLESGTDCYPAGSAITPVGLGLGPQQVFTAVGALHEDRVVLPVW